MNEKDIHIYFPKLISHNGNTDIEFFHIIVSEKVRLEIEKLYMTIQEKFFQRIEWYNNSIHSTTGARQIYVMEEKVDKDAIYEHFLSKKMHIMFVKNYKAVKHKYERRYRKMPLDNIQPKIFMHVCSIRSTL